MKSMLSLLVALALLAGCTSPEEQAFKRARMTDTVIGWEDFLRRYPDGEETEAARQRLVELHEDREWKRAELGDSVTSYQEYLHGFPQGRFAGEALVRIANINLREVPDHEPSPEELRAARSTEATPASPGKSVDDKAAAAVSAAPVVPPRGPTALINREARPALAPKPAVKLAPKPAPKPTPRPVVAPKPTAQPAPKEAPKPVAKPAAKPTASPAPKPAPVPAAAAGGGWSVQLGAFGKGEAAALAHWQRLERAVPGAVSGLQPDVVAPAEGKPFHRLRVVGLSRERAREVCQAVRAVGEGCVVTGP